MGCPKCANGCDCGDSCDCPQGYAGFLASLVGVVCTPLQTAETYYEAMLVQYTMHTHKQRQR